MAPEADGRETRPIPEIRKTQRPSALPSAPCLPRPKSTKRSIGVGKPLRARWRALPRPWPPAALSPSRPVHAARADLARSRRSSRHPRHSFLSADAGRITCKKEHFAGCAVLSALARPAWLPGHTPHLHVGRSLTSSRLTRRPRRFKAHTTEHHGGSHGRSAGDGDEPEGAFSDACQPRGGNGPPVARAERRRVRRRRCGANRARPAAAAAASAAAAAKIFAAPTQFSSSSSSSARGAVD